MSLVSYSKGCSTVYQRTLRWRRNPLKYAATTTRHAQRKNIQTTTSGPCAAYAKAYRHRIEQSSVSGPSQSVSHHWLNGEGSLAKKPSSTSSSSSALPIPLKRSLRRDREKWYLPRSSHLRNESRCDCSFEDHTTRARIVCVPGRWKMILFCQSQRGTTCRSSQPLGLVTEIKMNGFITSICFIYSVASGSRHHCSRIAALVCRCFSSKRSLRPTFGRSNISFCGTFASIYGLLS